MLFQSFLFLDKRSMVFSKSSTFLRSFFSSKNLVILLTKRSSRIALAIT